MDIKKELNGTPLPQRNAGGQNATAAVKTQPQQQKNVPGGQGNVDKKPNFINNNQKGGGPQNMQNRGGQNRGRFGPGGNNNNRNNQGGGGGNQRQGIGRRNDLNDNNGGLDRDRRGGGGGGSGIGGGAGGNLKDRGRKSEDFVVQQKLKNLQGPTHELPNIEREEVKFSGRNRLYIGNLPNDVNEEELKELFKPYGEISEAFINADKNFAFLKVDYRANAEKAKRDLDGSTRKNRQIRIRFAPNATTIRVKNLTPHVSNELLYKAFEVFGAVERAVIIVDDRGKSTGEGIVEYARKSGAMAAIRYCTEKCYFLTSSLRPCVCELFDFIDDTDGYPEKSINKKGQDFFKARQTGPRFADTGSFEHEYGTRWKQLHELYKQKHDALKREMIMEEEKLEAQMEYARYEHETEMLREQLRARELDRDQRKSEWEMKERYAEEQRSKTEEQMRRTQDEMAIRMNRQEDELRRRQQENTLFMQAQQLMMDAQEINQGNNQGNNLDLDRKPFGGGGGGRNYGMNNQDAGFMDLNHGGPNNRGLNRFDDQGGQGGGGGGAGARGGPRGGNQQWNDHRNDMGFQNKRRRF